MYTITKPLNGYVVIILSQPYSKNESDGKRHNRPSTFCAYIRIYIQNRYPLALDAACAIIMRLCTHITRLINDIATLTLVCVQEN